MNKSSCNIENVSNFIDELNKYYYNLKKNNKNLSNVIICQSYDNNSNLYLEYNPTRLYGQDTFNNNEPNKIKSRLFENCNRKDLENVIISKSNTNRYTV